MNRNLIIGIVVVVFSLLGLGFFFITRNPSSADRSTAESVTGETPVANGQVSQKQSLRSLLGLSSSQMCEFTDDVSGSSGKVYVSAGRVRGDFAVTVNGEVSGSHMYSDGQDVYIWMAGSDTGYKSSLDSMDSQPVSSDDPGTRANLDIDQQVDYKCQNWVADESLFRLPSGVDFKDFSTILQDQGVDCSTCDALTGEARTQCLTALGCSE